MKNVAKPRHRRRRVLGGASDFLKPRLRHEKRNSDRGISSSRRKKTRAKSSEERREWFFSPEDYSHCKDRFVIVSYNLLGVENASKHSDLYSEVSLQNLEWSQRKKLIRRELIIYKPSILCLQEVDRFSDLADFLHEDGYRGVYKGRTGEACDGCAIFWREDLFTILHQEDIEFQKFGLRDNVAQLCVLEMNTNQSSSSSDNISSSKQYKIKQNRRLLIGNIHVLFNPNRGDIKLGQVRVFLKRAHAISKDWGSIPVVVAGDLNSMPQSALYQFLASSELDILLHDRRKISGQIGFPLRWEPFHSHGKAMERSVPLRYTWSEEEINLAVGSKRCTYLRHHLNLHSAYPGVPGQCNTRDEYGEPLVTSYHSKFMGTVDYIWHSEELVPVGVVETLPIHILKKTGGLPSGKWGSDHLALVCELAFAEEGSISNH
ncbi:carbon catabolite repressor protein 4 homolog 5 [Aristolochia californica]|uniref:carbon catabolite repressor protein 4 homolog 5 n=1 Tax=Aristolochia californica TaxID=171875 RepID=UPI0035E312BF